MTKIKQSILIVLFIFAGTFAYAEEEYAEEEVPVPKSSEIIWFTPEKPVVSTDFIIPITFKRDLKTDYVGFENRTKVDFKELICDAGLSFQSNRFDLSTNVSYMPLFLNSFRAGVKAGYHLYRYFNVFTENDILLSARFRWCKRELFNWEFGGGLLFKFSDIDAMRPYRSAMFYLSYFLELSLEWYLSPKFDLYGTVKSIDYFDLTMLGTPFFKSGFNYMFADNLKLNMELTLKFIDMITSAVYLSECVFRTSVRLYF